MQFTSIDSNITLGVLEYLAGLLTTDSVSHSDSIQFCTAAISEYTTKPIYSMFSRDVVLLYAHILALYICVVLYLQGEGWSWQGGLKFEFEAILSFMFTLFPHICSFVLICNFL